MVRGPDWIWGDQDGGAGEPGTLQHLGEDGEARVIWERSRVRANYRVSGAADLMFLRYDCVCRKGVQPSEQLRSPGATTAITLPDTVQALAEQEKRDLRAAVAESLTPLRAAEAKVDLGAFASPIIVDSARDDQGDPEQAARRLLERQEREDLRKALEESLRDALPPAGAVEGGDIVERPVAASGDDEAALQWALRESEQMAKQSDRRMQAEMQWALLASTTSKDAADTSGMKVEAESIEFDSKEPRKAEAAGLERFPPSPFRNLRMDKETHQNKVKQQALAVKSESKIAKSVRQPAGPMNGGVPKSPAAAAAEARMAQLQRRGCRDAAGGGGTSKKKKEEDKKEVFNRGHCFSSCRGKPKCICGRARFPVDYQVVGMGAHTPTCIFQTCIHARFLAYLPRMPGCPACLSRLLMYVLFPQAFRTKRAFRTKLRRRFSSTRLLCVFVFACALVVYGT